MIEGVTPQLESVLAAGNHAASEANCQPWRFVVAQNHIEIHLIPERNTSVLNPDQKSSYFSIGGVIENIAIAASVLGQAATVVYFPGGPTHVASIDLALEPGIKADDLSPE